MAASSRHLDLIKIGVDTITSILNDNSVTLTKLGKVQIISLYSGIVFFIFWRILEMLPV
jgi:hypothetical protein